MIRWIVSSLRRLADLLDRDRQSPQVKSQPLTEVVHDSPTQDDIMKIAEDVPDKIIVTEHPFGLSSLLQVEVTPVRKKDGPEDLFDPQRQHYDCKKTCIQLAKRASDVKTS